MADQPSNRCTEQPMCLSFLIPALPPRELWPNRAKVGSGWEAKRWHGYRARLKANYEAMVWGYALKAHRETNYGFKLPPFECCALTIVFIVPSRRQYDADNLLAAFKSGQDALVKCGVLRGDGPDCILSTTVSSEYQKRVEGVRVTVMEVVR